MKKVIFAILITFIGFLSFTSCEKAPEITLSSPGSIEVSAQGGTSTITFTTNTDWAVRSSDSWVSVSPSSGTVTEDGIVTIKVSCTANTTYEDRSAVVTISAEDITQTVTVHQPANLGIIVPKKLYEITGKATIEVEVQSNVQYEVSISDDWITQTGTKGLVSDKLMFDVKDNDTYDARSASIVIKALKGEVPEEVVAVKQTQKDAILIDKASYEMPYGGGEIQVNVKANVGFDVKPDVDWIHYMETKALSTSTVRLVIDENKTFSSREGRVLISQQNGSLSYEISVKQAGRIAVTSVSLNRTELTLEMGATETLVATVKPDNASDKSVSWSSSNASIAVVENGRVTGISIGTATITARAGDKQATCTVTCVLPREGSSSPGLYLGIQGFNKDLYTFRIQKLDEGTISVFNAFIDGLSSDIGTLLYYSADNAIDRLKNTVTPSDLVNVAMLTFTDGLDEGSVSKKYRTDNYLYPSNKAYSSDIHTRITTEKVSGLPIVAYTIGLRGSDVTDLNEFSSNLKGLASSDAKAFEVSSMAEVNDRFHEIASQLNERNYIQSLRIHIPEPAPNTRVRFTFDNATSATNSKLYIEGIYDMTKSSLTNVVYKGMTCSSGKTVQGKVDGIFVDFRFDDVYTYNNTLITKDYVKEWKYNSSSGVWGVNSEFNKDTGFATEYTRRSALIMLNLDCSSSLGSDFSKLKSQAKSFIKKLVDGLKIVDGGSGNSSMETVDMGLSVEWASCNLGASSPEEYGDYYAWGEISTKSDYSWDTYKWCNGSKNTLTKYNLSSSYGTVDNKIVLEPEDDVAHVKLKGNWRMPSYEEVTELQENCTFQFTTKNGVSGWTVTSKKNGNSLFFPAAGYKKGTSLLYRGSMMFILSSGLYNNYNRCGWRWKNGNGVWLDEQWERCLGHIVRPVYSDSPIEVTVASVSLNKTSVTLTVGRTEALIATVSPTNATDKTVTWSSSNTAVATVSSSGVVTAKALGTATITAFASGKTASCTVTVTQPSSGPAAVDLGLSVKWASYNLGASSPEEYGDYYAWGETSPKNDYSWSTYKWCNGSKNTLTKYNTDSGYGTVDNKTTLELSDDAAHVNWGGSWRMPTNAEWSELITGCTWTWTTQNGKNGYKVTSKKNGNSIFLPAAGYRYDTYLIYVGSYGIFWSSSLDSDSPGGARYVDFDSGYVHEGYDGRRCYGRSVRPVSE